MPNVLVLDDEPSLLRLIVTILERAGHHVRSFRKPADALTELESFVPDAILSDIQMPGMSGLEFCQQVRAMPHLQSTPFLFMSALGNRTDVRTGMNIGADDYLVKPFTPTEIIEALDARLTRAAANRNSSSISAPSNGLQAKALGGFNVVYKGIEVSWASKKAAEFFFFLIERPNGVTTWEAAEALWRDKDESRAASVFHTTLHRLRKTLDEDMVFTKSRRYFLRTGLDVKFDVSDYLELVRQAKQTPTNEAFSSAVALYGGAYMDGCDSVWCEDKREMLHAAHFSLLLEAAKFSSAVGDPRNAAWYAHLATQHEPFADQAWTDLGLYYDALGDSRRAESARNRMSTWDE